MAKATGLGDNFYAGGFDLSGDVASLSNIGGGPALLTTTGINKSGVERLGGLRDGGMSFQSWFNDATGQQHLTLSPLPTTDVIFSYYHGTTLGGSAASIVAKQINYDADRGSDGALTLDVEAQANGFGVEWGIMHTPGIESDSAAADGTGVENLAQAQTTFGLQAYLHVFSFTGTDATIKIQESDDDASSDAYADVTGGGFTAVTSAPFTQRIATANNLTVEQWLRVITTTSGGFSAMTFAVMVVRNETTPVF